MKEDSLSVNGARRVSDSKKVPLLSDVSIVAASTEQGWHGGQLGDDHFGPTVQEAEWRYLGAPPQSGERLAPGL